jgi:glutamine synthetase
MKKLLEYVWLDANDNLRSKIKIHSNDDFPIWNFDGSSTGQATDCITSDIILNPVRTYNNPFFKINNVKSYIVLCECLNPDMTPHITNNRDKCNKMFIKSNLYECLFGIEQEYVIYQNNNVPYKWVSHSMPLNDENDCVQGEFYCSVGGNKAFGREISDKHLIYCLEAGINICGTNAEVAPSQWEFQIGTCDMLTVSDDLIVARYILDKIAEEHNCYISLEPKPFGTNWNGSGGHTNFSTKQMREPNGIECIKDACNKLINRHKEHINVYGKNNELRLTGIHETSSIDNCCYGVANRNCSIRIPLHVSNNNCGYLEDRRPASNLNPYLVTSTIVNTICS